MSQLSAAVFPGSFDPLTNGHLDIITRGLKIFDKIVIAVVGNPDKKTLFSVEERLKLIRIEFKEYGNSVQVESFSGLLVDFLRHEHVKVIIRGLRAISDFDYEAQLALVNRNLGDVETCFLVATEENAYISSSMVKQIAEFGGSVSRFVPQSIEEALQEKFRSK